jgi:hypothetical protein
MNDTDLSTAMLGRIGRHVMMLPLALGAAIGVLALGRVLGGALFGAVVPGGWVALSFVSAGLAIPVIYLGTAYRMLRCPACNGFVGWQVNAQATLFAHRYSRRCRHCGRTIFDDRYTRRARIAQGALGVGTFLFFVCVAIFR